MSRTVTALYDTRSEAEAAKQRLSSTVDVERVKIIDQEGSGSGGSSLSNLYITNEDRDAYREGLRRGAFLLTAEVHSGEDADKIVRLLEEGSTVDLDERSQSWRSEGWAPSTGTGSAASTGNTANLAAQSASATSGTVVEEQRIPIVEEELRVGKREVARGGARVRSYVREVPVHEQVTLREEHVHVERRPVDQNAAPDASGGDLLQERNIEMREMAEEAVVQKVAQVREEVVVSKTVEERTEQIDETVHRTEVDIQDGMQSQQRSAFGSFGGDTPASETKGSEAERIDGRK